MPRTNAIHPGPVRSPNDGEIHHISFSQLIRLYHLDPATCFDASDPKSLRGHRAQIKHYYPRTNGNYPVRP